MEIDSHTIGARENGSHQAATDRVKVLYIGGYGRSGSTLLVRLLGQLSGFHAVGEMWNIWQKCFAENELCGCGKPFKECEFWHAVVQRAFGGFQNVPLDEIVRLRHSIRGSAYLPLLAYPSLRTASQQSNIDAYLSVLKRLYTAIHSVSGSRVIIDSSKGPRYAMLLNEIPEIDLRVVHLTRDSRAVVYSWQKLMLKPEVHWKTEYMDRPNPVSAAINWNFTNLITQHFQRISARYKFLRYEDLVSAPRSHIASLIEFAGESVDDAGLDESDNTMKLSVDHTAVGNPNRFRQGPVRLSLDDEWRTSMPQSQRRLVTTLTLPLLRRYGYLDSRYTRSLRFEIK